MASLATYARITKPPMFRPNESVTIRMMYSQDLLGTTATLKIYGYICGEFKGWTSEPIVLRESVAGQAFQEFIVPANVLGRDPLPSESSFQCTGKMRAVVEMTSPTASGEDTVVYKSNEIILDMLYMWEDDFAFEGNPYNPDSSVCNVTIRYIPRTPIGRHGSTEVASYRLFLYDSGKKLISATETLTDWDTAIWHRKSYPFKNLKDKTRYYVSVQITLVGGYTLRRDYEPIYVHYRDVPHVTSKLNLVNDRKKGCVNISLPIKEIYTRAVISRSEVGEYDFLVLGNMWSSENEVTYSDYYAIPKHKYIYQVVLYNDSTIIDSYTNIIEHITDVVTIADIYGGYSAVGDIKKYPISRNDRGELVTVMDKEFPYEIINGSANYETGSVSGLFADVEDCKVNLDNITYSTMLRRWLNNGNAKLLKYYTGEAWIVGVKGISTDEPDENTDVLSTSFNWEQIGNAYDNSEYERLGLVVS